MSRIRLIGFALVLAASACATDGQGDGMGMGSGSGSGSGSGTGSGSGSGSGMGSGSGSGGGGNYVPVEGVWYYGDHTATANNCPTLVDPQQSAGNFGITNATPAGFHVIPNDGTDEFDCTLASSAFNCPNRALFDEDLGNGTLTGTVSVQGTLSSTTHATGTQHGHVTCTGAGCAAIGFVQGACDFTLNFTILTL